MTESLDFIWGRRPVQEGLRRGVVQKIYIAHGQRESGTLEEIVREAARARVPVARVSEPELARWVVDGRSQGVVAQVQAPKPVALETALAQSDAKDLPAFYLILDQIQDPHNLGALLRTANAVGIDAVVFPEKRSAPLSGAVAKSSAGAIHHVQLVQVVNLRRALDTLRKHAIWIVGLDEGAKHSMFDVDFTAPTAIVLGSEGEGLRLLTREACDLLVRLPMVGAMPSLNVSVAGAVAMYEVLRQRSRRTGSVG